MPDAKQITAAVPMVMFFEIYRSFTGAVVLAADRTWMEVAWEIPTREKLTEALEGRWPQINSTGPAFRLLEEKNRVAGIAGIPAIRHVLV
jgi:hypothetical protein